MGFSLKHEAVKMPTPIIKGQNREYLERLESSSMEHELHPFLVFYSNWRVDEFIV